MKTFRMILAGVLTFVFLMFALGALGHLGWRALLFGWRIS